MAFKLIGQYQQATA